MRRFAKIVAAASIAAAIVSARPVPAPAAGNTRTVVVMPIISATATAAGQPIRLPSGDARLIASMYVIAPGARLPKHHHPYPRYAYVLQGRLRVTDLKIGRSFDYKQGDVALEVVGDEHYGVSTGTMPLRLLVMDFVPKSVTNNTLR